MPSLLFKIPKGLNGASGVGFFSLFTIPPLMINNFPNSAKTVTMTMGGKCCKMFL